MAKGVQRWSKTAGLNASADAGVNWAEGMAPSAVNDSGRGEMASVAMYRDDISGTITTGGSSTAFTITTNQGFGTPLTAADMSGAMLTFIPHATSGLNPTLAVDGLTARAINQSTGVAVPTGALILGTPYVVTYIHATTEFILQGMIGAASFGDPTQIKSTDAGAGAGPTFDLFRDSASPAINDVLGSLDFNGRDSAANKQLYARIVTLLNDPVSTTEDASIFLQAVVAGALTTFLQSSGANVIIPGTLQLSHINTPLAIPGSTTANRSGSPTAGDTRYNTTLSGLEYWNGTAWIVLGQAPTITKLITGGPLTYTAPTGMVRARVRIWGPGGGGSGASANNGVAGSADTSWQVNASGTAWTAVKGSGGVQAGPGGAGGTGGTNGSTGTLVTRQDGGNGNSGGAVTSTPGGAGGSTVWGGAGPGAVGAGITAKANSGAGGGGGGSGATQGPGGGAGEYVEFWVTGMTSATYTIGLGGAGGAAGGAAGGNGAAGGALIEEFYS